MLEPWAPDPAASRAVLIGASTFHSDELPNLPAVAHNLDALDQVLTDPRHGVIGDSTVLADDDVTDAKVGMAVSGATQHAADLVLVYYAGHGVLDDDGRLHLARPDTSVDHVSWTGVSVDLLKRELGRARARARVLVLDCCFSGRAVTAMSDSRTLVAGQLDLSGTYTLTSTTATAPSHAPPNKRYTSFTHALLGALAQPDPLTLDGIYHRIDAELDGLGLPRPQHNATNNAAALALTRGPVLPSTRRPTPQQPARTPLHQRVFSTLRPPSPARHAILGVGWATGTLGLVLSFAALGAVPHFLPAVALVPFVFFVILSIMLFVVVDAGDLQLADQQLEVQLPLGRRARIPWDAIRTVRAYDLTRYGLRQRCAIEIETAEPDDIPPKAPLTPVPGRDRPTYRFGDINAGADELTASLRRIVGDKLPTDDPDDDRETADQERSS